METSTSVFSDTQMKIFLDRYAAAGETSPEQMWARVAKAVAINDSPEYEHQFLNLLTDFKFVPGGRILSSAGVGKDVTSYNCFVLSSPHDSRRGIMDSLSDWVEIQSRGGGVGINLSSLRPSGAHVAGVNGTSSGPVSWMEMYSTATKKVIQQGGSRRGAAMLMLDDSHPDVLEFIRAKRTPGVLEGANVSVCISDAFMSALAAGRPWDLHWGDVVYKTIDPNEIWKEIIDAAWSSAEPGIYFLDRANRMSNSWYFEKFQATNPCGEQPLGPYSVCLLGSMNAAAYVDDLGSFDMENFMADARMAVRFLDNVIDISYYPLEQSREAQMNIRRMGIGVMGLADALIMMGERYGSADSIRRTSAIYECLKVATYEASVDLATERGSFPQFSESYMNGEFIKRLPSHLQEKIAKYGIRNCFLTTQAPTGTTSLLAGVNSGIEPVFAYKTTRKDRTGEHVVWNKLAQGYIERGAELPDYFVEADEVTPDEHIDIQAAAQEHIDSSISKTCNLPNSATKFDVDKIYRRAYEMGLKSVTVYRDGSRNEQVLYKAKPELPVLKEPETIEEAVSMVSEALADLMQLEGVDIASLSAPSNGNGHKEAPKPVRRKMPPERKAITHGVKIGDHDLYITVGFLMDGTPAELFIRTEKEGSTIGGLCDALAVSISIGLQYGVPLETLIEKMKYRNFEPAGFTNNPEIRTATSIVDYIFKWLELKFVGKSTDGSEPKTTGFICPECNAAAIMVHGCLECTAQCGYTKCG